MKSFTYNSPVKIYFGQNSVEDAFSDELEKVGSTVMLAYGGGSIKKNGIYNEIVSLLTKANKKIVEFSDIMPNPTYAKVQEGTKFINDNNVDFILAVGGGSVIDCCKIISAQAKAPKDLWEMEFEDKILPTEFVPMGVVLTVLGTGSEMNAAAGITNEEINKKTAILGTYAKFAVLDPTYTMTVPLHQFLSGAFDTLSHCMETYFGKNDNVCDEMNEAVMKNVIKNIRKAMENPNDLEVRSELIWDSSIAENGILRLGKVTDFQCHSIEHQLCAFTNCNHGKALAVLHPVVYRHLYQNNIAKFSRFAKVVWEIDTNNLSSDEAAYLGVQALEQFIKEMQLPTSFTQLGLKVDDDIFKKVANTCNISLGCAKQFSRDEIFEILKECQ